MMTDFEAFFSQPEIEGELKDLEMQITKELNEMAMRSKRLQKEIERELDDLHHLWGPKCGGYRVDKMLRTEPLRSGA